MTKQACSFATALFLTAGTLCAWQGGPPPGPRGEFGRGPGPHGPEMGLHWGKVVTGAPYSADVSNQMVQTLADGNTITRTSSGHVARDSQGRMYSQETLTGGMFGANGTKTITFIFDPVPGYSYVLNPENKTATRRPFLPPVSDAAAGPRHAGGGSAPNRGRDQSNITETDLGTQTINGVSAHGKSVTHTVPAGAVGNSQPLVSTSETWYSNDLQTVVLAKRSDPRFGQSTFSLTNIQRAEPPASLFQVPSDYTITDAHGPGAGFGHGRPRGGQ